MLVLAAALVVPVEPASPQTVEEAARLNTELAIYLCWSRTGSDPAAWLQSFRRAGFSETIDGDPSFDVTHIFKAPADTVEVELYYGQTPDYCAVRTDHLGVTEGGALVDRIARHLFPGYARKLTTGPNATCIRYEDPANPIGHVIGVIGGADADGCVENGSAIFYSSYRV